MVPSCAAARVFGWEAVENTDGLEVYNCIVIIWIQFPDIRNAKERYYVREVASFDFSDSIIVSGREDPAIRHGRKPGNEVGVPLAG